MTETVEYKHPFSQQERFSWYCFIQILKELGRAHSDLDFQPETAIYVGGSALYAHCVKTFGSIATFYFRGTHDLDIMSFYPGAVSLLINRAMNSTDGSHIAGFSEARSNGKADKKTIIIGLKSTNDPSTPREIEADLFEPNSDYGVIRYNGRLLKTSRLIYDPTELVQLARGGRMEVSRIEVPSIRDYFLLKMDLAVKEFSGVGLRPKDVCDVLVAIRIAQETGVRFAEMVDSLVEDTRDQQNLLPLMNSGKTRPQIRSASHRLEQRLYEKLISLEGVLVDPKCLCGKLAADYPFMPRNGNEHSLSILSKAKRLCGI